MVASFSAGDEFAGYRIVRKLGSGGMGEVWLAEHLLLGRLEALKVVSVHTADSQFAQRFTNEARAAASLDHPGIVTVYGYGITDGIPWFTMNYLDGKDLSDCGPLPPRDVAIITERVADALDYAHARGVIHRDIKPANVVVQRAADGSISRVTVLDFGIARLLDGTRLTASNSFLGTLAYAPPETLTGQHAVPQSDQYSLACTAFQLLTGHPPFGGDNPGALMMQHINGPIPLLRDASPALASLDDVLTRGLAKSPDQRFATTTEFAAALRDSTRDLLSAPTAPASPENTVAASHFAAPQYPAPPYPPGAPQELVPPPRRQSRSSAALPGVVAVALLLIAGLVTWGVYGLDASSNAPTPVISSAPDHVSIRTLSAGTIDLCAASDLGVAYCWRDREGPKVVDELTNVQKIVTDWGTTCAITGGGELFCWGSNDTGQLGIGTIAESSLDDTETPQRVGLSNVTAIALDSNTACAVSSGDLYCWGDNQVGQLGDGTTTNSSLPVKVPGLTAVSGVSISVGTVCATAGGAAWCWGHNRYGQLGDGSTDTHYSPTIVPGLGAVTSVQTSDKATCAISDGVVYCWGNSSGLFGGRQDDATPHPTPAPVPGFGTVDTFALGGNMTPLDADNPDTLWASNAVLCAIVDGRAVCAGQNNKGQLGDGTTAQPPAPITVDGLTGVTQVAVSGSFGCAVADSRTYCWGAPMSYGSAGGQLPNEVHWPM